MIFGGGGGAFALIPAAKDEEEQEEAKEEESADAQPSPAITLGETKGWREKTSESWKYGATEAAAADKGAALAVVVPPWERRLACVIPCRTWWSLGSAAKKPGPSESDAPRGLKNGCAEEEEEEETAVPLVAGDEVKNDEEEDEEEEEEAPMGLSPPPIPSVHALAKLVFSSC